MFLFILLSHVIAGRIRPYGSRALTMSNVNPNGWSEYNFTMLLDTTLPLEGQLVISFPEQNYPDKLGLRDSFQIYAPYPTLLTPSQVDVTKRLVTINIGQWSVIKPLTITIRGVINSQKSGGTGNFILYTKVGTCIVDSNMNFAVVGLAQETIELLSATITADNYYAGEVTNYIATLQPLQDLQPLVDFIITFPELYDLSYLLSCTSNLFTPTCKVHNDFKNMIYVLGNNQTIAKGTTIQFTFKDVINPSRKMKTPLFNFKVMERDTNNTLQQSVAVNGLQILPGLIKLVTLTSLYYKPYVSYIRDFTLKFRPKNSFQYARIVTDFYQIMSCSITRGLLDLSQQQDSLCAPLGKMMFLSNFQSYVESDYSYEYIEVQFNARIADFNILTNPVEIYTYQDSSYLLLADQDTESIASQIYIHPQPNLAGGSITSTPNTISSTATITVSFNINLDLVSPQISIEIPIAYTGVPTCQYMNKGGTLQPIVCSFALGYLNVTVDLMQCISCTPSCPKLVIDSLSNPSVGGSYPFRALITSATTSTFNTTLIILTPQFGSGTSVSQVSNNVNTQTMINFNLNIDGLTPAGVKTLADPYVSFSLLELRFFQQNLGDSIFTQDMGTGVADLADLGCSFQGMTAAQGSTLQCVIIHGLAAATSASYVTVKIFGYASITPPAWLSFKVPLKYPATVNFIPKVQVLLVRYDAKVRNVMRSQSYNLGSVKSVNGNALSVFSGPVLENPKLQVETTLQYQFKTVYSIAVNNLNGIYFQIPSGFTFDATKILVSIDGSYISSKNIQHFKSFIFIMVENNFSNGVLHTLIFERVDVPNSLPSATITHAIKTTLNGQFADTATFTVPSLAKGTLLDMTFVSDTLYQNHPYANYSIAFTTSMKSLAGSSITIDFPGSYNLLNCLPILDNIPFSNLNNASDTTLISFSYTANQFKIQNFAPLVKGQRVFLGLFSIKNPVSGSYSFTIKINDASGNVIEDGIKSITISSTNFVQQSLNVVSGDSLPNNAVALATYIFQVKLDFKLPKFAVFHIKFPASFTSLYTVSTTAVTCRVFQNSEIALRKCEVDEPNNEVVLQIDRPLIADNVQIEYQGLLSQTASTGGVIFTVQYNNINIAQGSCPIIPITGQLNEGAVTMKFHPRNEGEIAYYKFYLPLVNFDILSTYRILIRFPFDYDYSLGIEKLQVKSTTLKGALKFNLFQRHIIVTGFYDQKSYNGTLDIIVLGVINPNRKNNQETGTFAFGILNEYTMLAGKMNIPGVIPQLAPQGISLNGITSSTLLSRYSSTFVFNIQAQQAILATVFGGQVYVDFPDDFLIDSFSGGCTTTSDFSFFASCDWDYFRFIFQTNNQEWTSQKALQLTISSVRTPENDGETKNFIIYNYDATNEIILGRTYSNLHISSLIYVFDGLQIDINYKLPYNLEVGSYSDEIQVNMTDIAKSTITLSPNVLDSNIIITPNPVQIQAGTKIATFRLAAPRTILLQTYYIQWSKTGDTLPVTYAPLRLTPIQMVKGTLKRKMIVEQMEYIPKNGSSYPLYITTNNPPYQQLLIRLSFYPDLRRQQHFVTDAILTQLAITYIQLIENNIPLEGITQANLSSTQLEMLKQQYSVHYQVNTSIEFPNSTLQIYLALKGYDADSFELDTTTLIIPIREQEFRKPKILEAKALQITRSTATFQVFGDIKGFIYFVYADQHMPDPLFNETQFAIPNDTLSYSNPSYGIDYIRTSPIDVNFTITGLLPLHDYEIFIFIVNLNLVSNPTFTKVYFQTMKSQLIALLTLKINQATIDSEVKLDYLQKMSEMITISKTRLIERTTKCAQTTLDVAPTTSYMYWNLIIIPDPANMNEYTKPLVLAQTLNSRRTEIQKFITRLDDEPFFTIEEISENIPNFVVSPQMVDRTISSICVRFKISYCGIVYLSLRQRSNSTNLSIINETIFAQELASVQFPSAYQIKQGLNETNQPLTQISITVENTETYYQKNYTDLEQKTVYDVYISMENDFLINKELFSNNSVARFTAKTMKIIVPLNIYSINYQIMWKIVGILIILGIQ